MLQIEDIIEIRKAEIYDRGYEIVFPNNKIIWLTKRRTIAGLLLLIKYEICSEEDLVGANGRLREIKNILKGKINDSWIQDRYGDANKPFSELWTEEGFSSIHAEGLQGAAGQEQVRAGQGRRYSPDRGRRQEVGRRGLRPAVLSYYSKPWRI